jgi:hypothetical protein
MAMRRAAASLSPPIFRVTAERKSSKADRAGQPARWPLVFRPGRPPAERWSSRQQRHRVVDPLGFSSGR